MRPPERVAAVELNAETIRLVSEDFGEFSGDVYHHPHVTAVANEGRSHLTHSDQPYDLIQISLIDSWAASAAGAFALAENNLYTVETFDLYRERLTPRGVLSVSRWTTELPRLLLLARASLERAGYERRRPSRPPHGRERGDAPAVRDAVRSFGPGRDRARGRVSWVRRAPPPPAG